MSHCVKVSKHRGAYRLNYYLLLVLSNSQAVSLSTSVCSTLLPSLYGLSNNGGSVSNNAFAHSGVQTYSDLVVMVGNYVD